MLKYDGKEKFSFNFSFPSRVRFQIFINSKPGTNQMFEPKSQRKTDSLQIQ